MGQNIIQKTEYYVISGMILLLYLYLDCKRYSGDDVRSGVIIDLITDGRSDPLRCK
jgi:hypothetical protein